MFFLHIFRFSLRFFKNPVVLLDNLDKQSQITVSIIIMVSVGMQVDLWSSNQIKPCLAHSLIKLPF